MAKELATLGGGCFWCLEAVFEQISGVESVVSGYSGGQVVNPTYRAVCEGNTGHAEVVRVAFDLDEIVTKIRRKHIARLSFLTKVTKFRKSFRSLIGINTGSEKA